MRLIALLLLVSFSAIGQNYDTTKYFRSKDVGWQWKGGKFDTALLAPRDTIRNKRGIAQIGSTLYVGNGTMWTAAAGTTMDTTILSTRRWRQKGIDSLAAITTLQKAITTSGILTQDNTIDAGVFTLNLQADSLRLGGVKTNVSGRVFMPSLTAGVITDSILTRNPTTNRVHFISPSRINSLNTLATVTAAGNSTTQRVKMLALSLGDTTNTITSSGSGALAMGLGTSGGSVISSGFGSAAFGFSAGSSATITSNNQGSLAFGSSQGVSAQILSSSAGSISHGFVSDVAVITSTSVGSHASGYGFTNGLIRATNWASFAGGVASNDTVNSSGQASFVYGRKISSTGNYSYLFGTNMTNTNNNRFMVGWDRAMIQASTSTVTMPNATIDSLNAQTSGGLKIYSHSGTQIANLGAGGGSNVTWNGGNNFNQASGYSTNINGSLSGNNFTTVSRVDSIYLKKSDSATTSLSNFTSIGRSQKLIDSIANGTFWRLGGNSTTTGFGSRIGTTSNTSLRFVTNGTEKVFIDSANTRLGIGISTPLSALHINSGKTALTSNAAFNTLGINVDDTTSLAAGTGGGITFRAIYNASRTQIAIAAIEGFKESEITADFRGSLRFFTGSNVTGYPNEVMRINSSGIVGIGTTSPSASALVDITSTTKGFLPPRMTTAQRDAISSPATGLMIYDTTVNKVSVYNGSSWKYLAYE